jgi:hypothetical protein
VEAIASAKSPIGVVQACVHCSISGGPASLIEPRRHYERVKPFQIDVAEDVLDDLRSRLAGTRWPEAECVDDWSQGIPLNYTRELAGYWANDYDWRSREAAAAPRSPGACSR